MIEFKKFPSISGHVTDIIKEIKHKIRFIGLDNEGDPIYSNVELPKLTFVGTVKGHGTNGAVCYNNGNVFIQSRKSIITPDKDNYGFARWVESNKDKFKDIFEYIISEYKLDTDSEICIYGEWSGSGIQKKVAISQIDKFFSIFKIKVNNVWVDLESLVKYISNFNESRIFNIFQFGKYEISIDFSDMEDVVSKEDYIRNTLTLDVEKQCPIGKFFGVNGIGEGIVWGCINEGFNSSRFWLKTKGEAHSGGVSDKKQKTFKDIEQVKTEKEFIDQVVTINRLDQILNEMKNEKLEISRKNTGVFIRRVYEDVIKEEMNLINQFGFDPKKDVGKVISNTVKDWYFKQI